MGCWRPWEEEEEEVYGWDPGRVFINRGASVVWCLGLRDGHYRCPTYDADNGVPRLPKSPRFPALPTICRGCAATGGSFIHSSILRLRPSLLHTQTLTWTPSRTRSDVIASSRQTQRRRPAAGSIKERWSACVCVWGSECVCVSEGLTAQR